MITVLATPALNTVQDQGRFEARQWGVSTSGAMDGLALAAGNALLNNPEDCAAVEVQNFPVELRFDAAHAFAVTGADCDARLDGRLLPPWWVARAGAGQVLTLARPRTGARAYLCVAGGIDVPVVLGSRSTYLRSAFGGFEGRSLQPGDVLPVGEAPAHPVAEIGAVPPRHALASSSSAATADNNAVLQLRVIRGGEFALFPGAAQALFWNTDWKISSQSDRSGYRLSGPKLLLDAPMELRSYGVVPGIVQVPPGGEPIIQLSDANTAGGYPKMAGVIEADLWKLGQARLGARLRFVEVAHGEAVAAMGPLRDYLADIRQVAALQHQMPAAAAPAAAGERA